VLFGLLAVFFFLLYPQLLFLLVSGIVSLLLLLGFWAFPSLKREIPIVLDPTEGGEVGLEKPETSTGETFSGGELFSVERAQRVTLSIRLKNLPMLLATGVTALVGFALYITLGGTVMRRSELSLTRYAELFALGYCSFFFLAVAWLWLNERAILKDAGVAIGAVQRPSKGRSTGRWVAYSFRDRDGHYHGGTKFKFGKRADDNIVLVVFNQAYPDWNMPSWDFIFHRIELISPSG
jgi:hypothetical protein